MTTSPISNIDLSETTPEDKTNMSDQEQSVLKDMRRTPMQKAEIVQIPQKLDYYTLYYRTAGGGWLGGNSLHLNPKGAFIEMQTWKTSYDQFQVVKITLPV